MNELAFDLHHNDRDRDDDDDVYLTKGDAIDFMGKVFVVEARAPRIRGYIFSDPDAPGKEVPLTNREIKTWHKAEKLRFIMQDEFSLPLGRKESLKRTMRAFKPAERKEIFRRLKYCLAIQALPRDFSRSKASLQPVCDAVANARGDTGSHHWTTVYRWWKDWIRAGRDPRVLASLDRRKGNRNRKIEQYKIDAIAKGIAAWKKRLRPHMATAYKECTNHCITVLGKDKARELGVAAFPSERLFRKECRRISRTEKLATRYGDEAARQEMYPVGAGVDVRFAFERVEADFKFLRLFVVDDKTGLPLGTPYLMAAIDCYSGCVAGFDLGFDPPSYVSVGRCLKHIIDFKDVSGFPDDEDGRRIIRNSYPINGVPHALFLDNDTAFHAESLYQSAIALGCHVDFIPAAEPWKKGHIERFWSTVQDSFLDMFPGKVIRVVDTPGKDYDPADDAVLTLTQLRMFITKAIVDVYHEGIDDWSGKRRIDLWKESVAINPPRPVRDHESLLELVGTYEIRTAERRGIRLNGLRYNSPDLALYRAGFEKNPKVEIRYDEQDMSVVWLIDANKGISFRIPCTRPDYAEGLSLHQHRVIRRHAIDHSPAGRMRMVDLIIAKAALYKLGKAMLAKKASRAGRQRLAQFMGVGREMIDAMARRRDDPAESAKPLGLDDDDQIEDPQDDARARRDEAEVIRLQKENHLAEQSEPSNKKPSPKKPRPAATTPPTDPEPGAGSAVAPEPDPPPPAPPPIRKAPPKSGVFLIEDDE